MRDTSKLHSPPMITSDLDDIAECTPENEALQQDIEAWR